MSTQAPVTAPDDLMSISDLAAALTKSGDEVERSTLSRYVAKHSLARAKQGRSVLCSFAEVKAHRSQNYQRELMGGAVLGVPTRAPDETLPASGATAAARRPGQDVTPPATDAQPDAFVPANDPHRREKLAKALAAEMDLQERVGLLVTRAEAEAGVAAAVSRWTRVSDRSAVDAAEKLMAELELPVRHGPIVKQAFRKYLNTCRAELSRQCREISAEIGEGGAVKSDARMRFDRLLAHAHALIPNPLSDSDRAAL